MPKISVIPWIVKKLKGAIGIVEDTDTAVHAIASGKYVVWKGTLCKTLSAIAVNDTLSTGTGGNLTAVEDGGLNDVNGNIPAVYNGLDSTSTTDALSAAQGKELNSKIDLNYDLGSFSTLNAMGTALLNYVSTLPVGVEKYVSFAFTVGQTPFADTTYFANVKRAQNGNHLCEARTVLTNEIINGRYRTSTSQWYWNNITGELNSNLAELTKTTRGTTISLDSYTSADYTFLSDGYLVATCESSSSAKAIVQIKDSNGNNFAKLGGWSNSTYATYSCYVKKGMKARVITLENSGHVNYEPFS